MNTKNRINFHQLLLIPAFLLICLCTVNSQEKYLSRKLAIADIDTLIYSLESAHPDLYAVFPKQVFKDSINDVKVNLPDSLSISDFHKRIAPCLTLLGDGHTSFDPPKLQSFHFFPLHISIANDSSISVTGTQKQIHAINGITDKSLIKNMLRYFSGESTSFRISSLQTLFPICLANLYPAEKFKLRIIENGLTTDTVIDGITADEIMKVMNTPIEKPNYSYHYIPEKNTVVFEFYKFNNKKKFSEFLTTMFSEIQEKEVRNLIIDIRNNGGGSSDLGDELFQYISSVPFIQFGKMVYRVSPQLRNFSPSVNEQFKQDGIFTHEINENDLIPLRENPLRYAGKGNIYLLTSNNTFSSASSFAWTFKYLKMGTIAGRETGGQAISFGDMLNFKLPNSGLGVHVSWKKFYMYGATDKDNHGTFPDIDIPAEEALNYVLKSINKD